LDRPFVPLKLISNSQELQIPLRFRVLTSSVSKKKEPKLVRLDGRIIKCETVELSSWVRDARGMIQKWKLFIKARGKKI
jgi:hypothetical protein